jgi:hypothetical protein
MFIGIKMKKQDLINLWKEPQNAGYVTRILEKFSRVGWVNRRMGYAHADLCALRF